MVEEAGGIELCYSITLRKPCSRYYRAPWPSWARGCVPAASPLPDLLWPSLGSVVLEEAGSDGAADVMLSALPGVLVSVSDVPVLSLVCEPFVPAPVDLSLPVAELSCCPVPGARGLILSRCIALRLWCRVDEAWINLRIDISTNGKRQGTNHCCQKFLHDAFSIRSLFRVHG